MVRIGFPLALATLLATAGIALAAEPVVRSPNPSVAPPADATVSQQGAADAVMFSRFLALVQDVMQAAAAAPAGKENQAAERVVREALAGRNPEANALALHIFAALPPEDRARLLAIGRSASELAERGAINTEREEAVARTAANTRDAIDARKDLAAMGFVYYDRAQFLDAIQRGDTIAVQLFVRGRAVDLRARDASGATALDLARRSGNAEIVALLARAMQ